MITDGKCCGGSQGGSCANNTGDALKSCFFSIPPAQFSLLSSLIGILLLCNLDLNQQNSLGNFFVGIGQSLLTAAAQGATLQSSNQQNDRISEQIKALKKEIELLERELK